ncbi:uncharacterized protein LOC113134618 [Mastacembelus armatus]|uniref:uncharacterized protein LOC113134618 n=1 Tax=Mastacembelus armatus TaxID=205130 RepID=UPI000E45CEE0|nr:uncharacterized protein LOC113134618 [Mastacembelus armatus]
MDDGGKQSHTFGSGQQRMHHPRPFFYVQPPSQPYYLYQHWQLNSPYSHCGFPGGFNFGRPCMHPYQYMPYTGFFFPHASVYPLDYRRMFEPCFHAPTWNDMSRQQHHPQPYGHKEMACSEAQTDPNDAITKLIECLDKGTERELDSGVALQSSGMYSPGDERKNEEQGSAPVDSQLVSAAITFTDFTTAVYDGETSQRSIDTMSPQGCWSGGLEEELPLDSSSVHEDRPELRQPGGGEHFLHLEKEKIATIQSDILVTSHCVPKCDDEEVRKLTPSLAPLFSSKETVLKEAKSSNKGYQNTSYQILKLPFDSVLTLGAGCLTSPVPPHYYDYLSMQTTHERLSVLSPSLDELSSKDEMFSTDMEDRDLLPKHVYTDRRLAGIVGASPPAAEEVVWLPGSRRFVCACCGKSLTKGTGRSIVHSSKIYKGDARDSEEESQCGSGYEQHVRVVVRKHSAPRKLHSIPVRHATKACYKQGQYDTPVLLDPEEVHNLCKQEPADGEIGDVTHSAEKI